MGVLDEKVAIVTGSARGIGKATAEILSQNGARVALCDLDVDLADQTARGLAGDCVVYGGDLTKERSAAELIKTAIDAWGRLDIVVNNAGYTWDGAIHKMSDEQFNAMLEVHTVAPFRVLRAAAPHLREPAKLEREAGREVFRKIVNVSSISGTMGNAGQANYASAKAGVVGLTKTLAKEWGPLKINVNAVAFGYVDTRLTADRASAGQFDKEGRAIQLGVAPGMRELATATIPLGRPARPEEAAGPVFFLCSPWSDYVNGQVLNVTGGQSGGMDS
jgi:3-oxoacyl-[acyl-carrier protein] reductase